MLCICENLKYHKSTFQINGKRNSHDIVKKNGYSLDYYLIPLDYYHIQK